MQSCGRISSRTLSTNHVWCSLLLICYSNLLLPVWFSLPLPFSHIHHILCFYLSLITSSAFITGLLNNIGTHVDPILLIHRIKEGMEIPNLRDSLVKILQDYNLQVRHVDCRLPFFFFLLEIFMKKNQFTVEWITAQLWPNNQKVEITLGGCCQAFFFRQSLSVFRHVTTTEFKVFRDGKTRFLCENSITLSLQSNATQTSCCIELNQLFDCLIKQYMWVP